MSDSTGIVYPAPPRRGPNHRTRMVVPEDNNTSRLRPVKVYTGDQKALRAIRSYPEIRKIDWIFDAA